MKATTTKVFMEAAIALVQNLAGVGAIFFLGQLLNAWTGVTLVQDGSPLGLINFFVASTLMLILGTLVFLGLRAVTPKYQPIFTVLVALVLVGMAITPFNGINGGNLYTIILLEVSHLVPAGFLWYRLKDL